MLISKVVTKDQEKAFGGAYFPLHKKTRLGNRQRDLRKMCSAARTHGYLSASFLCFVLLTFAQALALAEEEEIRVAFAQPHIPASESAKRRVRIWHD